MASEQNSNMIFATTLPAAVTVQRIDGADQTHGSRVRGPFKREH